MFDGGRACEPFSWTVSDGDTLGGRVDGGRGEVGALVLDAATGRGVPKPAPAWAS